MPITSPAALGKTAGAPGLSVSSGPISSTSEPPTQAAADLNSVPEVTERVRLSPNGDHCDPRTVDLVWSCSVPDPEASDPPVESPLTTSPAGPHVTVRQLTVVA
jgi:hypothetical protein